MPPTLIALEGPDGAGKTTTLHQTAHLLKSQGTPLTLPRPTKHPTSKPAQAIRQLTRDRTNLDLTPRAELLLYAAREAQILSETVTPALAAGHTVLLDRSMLTPLVLGAHGRGLDLAACEAITAQASAGLVPELTIVFDVDPRTSRLRKRLDKLRRRPVRDGGRKGLAGSAFKARIRAGYLALAARDGLPVLHAERATPAQLAARVLALIAGDTPRSAPEDAIPYFMVEPGTPYADALDTLPPPLRLYFSRHIPEGRAIRAALFDAEPTLAIWAADPHDPLLERALATAPQLVLERLARTPRTTDLDPLRARLAAEHPREVARSLRGLAGRDADALRLRLAELDSPDSHDSGALGAVVESLGGRCDTFAHELRARLWRHADSYERAASLRGCDDAESWRRRERLFERDPAVALSSLLGLHGPRVDDLLDAYAGRAPKPVLQALAGRDDAHAHGLRLELLETGSEVLDTIVGLDDPASWRLRERCVERWPWAVLASLGGFTHEHRGDSGVERLAARCRERAPGDLFVLRQLHLLHQRTHADVSKPPRA
ncbi:hypothetical protein G6O69_36315 [Pseudenhygromyxa sp. WMMC2535]|uniref:hypothetical protein n=1 Tax=Pseudenhygromyxa sp. WMMC2535 TaxID=2712867 RepID=UPI0015546598|nr:hypothetical protein [Pseudenhygromyxa sp. WMMC2535]NVB43347.1 hypothetical protein [Pseudenhygromyxa sp. WMMC2535]